MLQMSPETPPKYKRRKIFAIRQFPPGCSTSAVKSDPKASEKTIFLVALENGKVTEIDEVLAASNVVDKSAISSLPVLEEMALDIPCSSKASVSDVVEPPNCSTTDLAENNTESNSEAGKLEEKDVMDNKAVLEINLENNPEMEKLEVHQVLENSNPETEKLEVHQVLENSNSEMEKLEVHQVLENSNPETGKLEVHQVLENSNPDTEKLEVHQVLENCNPERMKEEVQQVMTESSEPVKLQNSFCYSKMCAPTRRKISAVRQFPPGCGPACAAPSSSSDKSFVRVEIDQVSKHLVGEGSVKVVDDEALRGEMRSNEGKEVVKEVDIGISSKLAGKTDIISPKSNSLHQEMAGVSTLVGSTKKLLHAEENKPSLRQSTLIDGLTQMKGDENTLNHDNTMMKQTITIDESVKVLSSDRKVCRVTKEKEIIHERAMVRSNSDKNFRIQDLSGHVQVKTSLKSGSNKKTLLKSESNELLVCPSSEKTLESLKVVQTTQSIHTKANASSLSPIVAKSQSETKRLNKGVTPSMEKPLGKENEIDQKSSKKRTFPDEISHKCYSPGEDDDPLDDIGEKMIILALMASKNCPWRNTMKRIAVSSDSSVPKSKIRRERRYADKAPTSKNYFASQHKRKGLIEDDDDTLEGGNDLSITMTPFAPPKSSQKGGDNEEVLARHKVMRVLRLFQLLCRKFLQGEESRSNKSGKTKRIDLLASGILKDKREWVNCSETIIGRVPGVEIGDEFHFRVELAIIGLHRPFQGGIDCTKKKGMLLATSIVASGGYQDDMDSSDVLIYSGSGGTSVVGGDKQKGHQKLERGNLALKNSISAQTPVRVIHGFKEKASESHDANARVKFVTTYIYDGLYYVESYWQEMNSDNYYVFKFQLRRMAQQPELAFKELKRSAKLKIREGLCVKDISQGKEKIGISVVNTIDTEQPMPFKYITKSIYPSWYAKTPPSGCDCINGCSDSDKCACAVKNGGEIPFNYNGAIVQAKKLIYECGPACKCSSSCHNKVSQRGIKMQLEIFKTRGRGWGVRSLKSISSGTFICEYIGELLQDGEAEQRTNDEYLFDIGHNYDDRSLWEDLPNLIPGLQSSSQCDSVESVGFTIDAAEHGNVGRFINHSCSPNLYAQNVLYDHDDKRMPHIMFFAVDNIPPLQELTYHYNYTINEVRDSEGNIKQKACHCGSPECCGRLY